MIPWSPAVLAVHWYRTGFGLSPDGTYYGRAALGLPVPSPYHRRWLWPRLLGVDRVWWTLVALGSLAGTACFFSPRGAWLFLWLPMVALGTRLPVLVDAPAFLLALGSSWAATRGDWAVSAALGLLAGASKESAPVFAAAWSMSPWPLVGLLAAGWWIRPGAPDQPWLERPWATARRDLLDWRRTLLPWGSLAPMALLAGWSWSALLSLALGYAQCLRSQDDARLYQWAAPPLLALADGALGWWVLPLLAIHPFLCAAHRGT